MTKFEPASKLFSSICVEQKDEATARPRLSMTADIISYRKCSKQYGRFRADGFEPSQAAQIFYGTIIHQVLDQCHRHYWGYMAEGISGLPTDTDIDQYFEVVRNELRSHGIRPPNKIVAGKALERIKAFNRLEGPDLYARVTDTEYRLESDRDRYLLRGVVDVLAQDSTSPNDPSKMELWDYKGTQFPDLLSAEMRDYEWQMCVYAELYRVKSGVFPAKAVLYFLDELDGTPPPTKRPVRAVHEVEFTEVKISEALSAFDLTADEVIAGGELPVWPSPKKGDVSKKTCDICDLRWDCEVAAETYKVRLPIVE